jgi:hypothetical protein
VSAAPFGGHPTLGEYMRWATDEHGCTVQSGYARDENGVMVCVTRIETPSGSWVVETGTEQWEYLAPTTVGRFDRRLGLESPFASMPP